MRSNTFLLSINTSPVPQFLSKSRRSLSISGMRAVSVEWNLQNPDWR